MTTRKKDDRLCITASTKNIDHAFQVLMDILSRPSLGHLVRYIEHCQPLPGHLEYNERGFQRELPDRDMRLRKAIQKAGFTDAHVAIKTALLICSCKVHILPRDGHSRYCEDCEVSDVFTTQALTALLVAVSPKLVSIAMIQPFCNFVGYYQGWGERVEYPLDKLFRAANAKPYDNPYLQNLLKFYVINEKDTADGRWYHGIDFLGCFALFDRLPSIEWVGIDILDDDGNEKPDPLRDLSNISRICVTNSAVGSTYLAKMIVSCKALKEFQFSIGGRACFDGYSMFNPEAFAKALCSHKATLEFMHVGIEDRVPNVSRMDRYELEGVWDIHECPFQISDHIVGRSGSLKEFTSLKKLSLGIGLLGYFARGTGWTRGMLADWENKNSDAQIDGLRENMKSVNCNLMQVYGLDKTIPHARDVDNPDDDAGLLWKWKTIEHETK
ncbi:hypothetical protein N7456_004953 [Penicillium angulare]|uniref:Uncharacterized protein n=1 Tax=Penicillium angulare TaxID=116970 RepID=A0A9W9FXI5_9EURO|nr:hypothetical protein N7456_004953 [Penicillium angulare]